MVFYASVLRDDAGAGDPALLWQAFSLAGASNIDANIDGISRANSPTTPRNRRAALALAGALAGAIAALRARRVSR